MSPLHPPKSVQLRHDEKEEELFSPQLHPEPARKVSDNDAESIHSQESLSVTEMECDDEEFNPWQFIANLPPYANVKYLTPAVALPPKTDDKLTIVLDLDETLVHCTVEDMAGADFNFPVVFHGIEYQVHVKLRPHLQEFLDKIAGKYEVVVFTASQKVYADELLNRLDPGECWKAVEFLRRHGRPCFLTARSLSLSLSLLTENKYFQHRLFRESCLAVEGNFLKDLNVLGRDLSRTVLVDNSPHAFGYQVDNGVPIESWFDDETDCELLKLERFLRQLKPDVRDVCRRKFRLQERVNRAPPYTS